MGKFATFKFLMIHLAMSLILAKDDLVSLKGISSGLNKFSADLLKHINDNWEEENLVFSPLSAHSILSLTAYGADGNTAKQMKSALNLPNDDSTGKKEFQHLTKYMNKIENVTLEIANSVYLSNTLKLKPEFKDLSSSYFLADASELDFNNVDESINLINHWASERTHNKIPAIVNEDNIDSETRMILLNAVYFKGKWAEPFVKELTSEQPFHLTESIKKDVAMMSRETKAVWGEIPEHHAKFVKLPYENKNLKMILIVPDEIDGLTKILPHIDFFNRKVLDENSRTNSVLLNLPRFKVETKIDLKKPLAELGMIDMFSDGSANFAGISDEKIKVAQVFQKAMIEVNEEGSTAAAVTVVGGNRYMGTIPVRIDVNRPFYYKIVDELNDLVLFEGVVRNPVY